MLSTYVLIMVFVTGGHGSGSTVTAEFTSYERCSKALELLSNQVNTISGSQVIAKDCSKK